MALWEGHEEAAKILARKGADCQRRKRQGLVRSIPTFNRYRKGGKAREKAKRKKQRARGKWENWQCQGGEGGKEESN